MACVDGDAHLATGGEHGGRLTLGGSWLLKRTLWSPPPDPGRAGTTVACQRPRAHNGDMRRIIGTIVGAIVAVSLAITSVGSIVATLKTFLIIGLIAMAVIIIVWLVARRPRSAVRRD